ncbi:MAG: hypothetical protein MK137_00795 [Rickettsiales bacterium]|nr:hypothetical protein [Rickettsiales bacterium]
MKNLPVNVKTTLIFTITAILVSILTHIEQVPGSYHINYFVDTRSIMGIENFYHVFSSVTYAFVGLFGIYIVAVNHKNKDIFHYRIETVIWYCYFLASFSTCFGSIYFHLNPVESRIIWDQIPSIIMLSCIFSYIIFNWIQPKAGFIALPITIIVGIGSSAYWSYQLNLGNNNMLLFFIFKLSLIVITIMVLKLFNGMYHGAKYIKWIVIWYIVSLLFKQFDGMFFFVLARSISGHSLLHLALAISIYYVIVYLLNRKKIAPEE